MDMENEFRREKVNEKGGYRCLIILRKAAMEDMRVTICARPVRASVTVIAGQEKARNCSNVSKKWPHVRSCLG